jgi:hypothetical protein
MFIDLPEKSLVWLGAADIHQEGDWKWYNPETPMSFTYWSSNGPQPNNALFICIPSLNASWLYGCLL